VHPHCSMVCEHGVGFGFKFCAPTMVADITKAETDSTTNDVLFSLSIVWLIFYLLSYLNANQQQEK
jgi:hypothetical protein